MSTTSSGQAEIPVPAKSKTEIEKELERRLRARTNDKRGTLVLSGQSAHQQADLFGRKETK